MILLRWISVNLLRFLLIARLTFVPLLVVAVTFVADGVGVGEGVGVDDGVAVE